MKKGIIGIIVVTMLLSGCVSYIHDGAELLEAGQYKEAIETFETQIAEEERLDEAYRGIAIANFELGNYEEVIENFKKAMENGAKPTAAMYQLMATSYMYCEDYENALSQYAAVVEMEDCTDEMKKEALFNTIAIYEGWRDWESAKEAVNTYLQFYPDDERVLREAEFLQTR